MRFFISDTLLRTTARLSAGRAVLSCVAPYPDARTDCRPTCQRTAGGSRLPPPSWGAWDPAIGSVSLLQGVHQAMLETASEVEAGALADEEAPDELRRRERAAHIPCGLEQDGSARGG